MHQGACICNLGQPVLSRDPLGLEPSKPRHSSLRRELTRSCQPCIHPHSLPAPSSSPHRSINRSRCGHLSAAAPFGGTGKQREKNNAERENPRVADAWKPLEILASFTGQPEDPRGSGKMLQTHGPDLWRSDPTRSRRPYVGHQVCQRGRYFYNCLFFMALA